MRTRVFDFKETVDDCVDLLGGQVLDNKKIVVIGFGESSVDVAAEAGKRGEKSYLSFRRGKLIIPRKNPLNNLANDFDTNRLRYSAPTWVRNLIMLVRRKICARAGHSDPSAIVRAYFLDTVRSWLLPRLVLEHCLANYQLLPLIHLYLYAWMFACPGRSRT